MNRNRSGGVLLSNGRMHDAIGRVEVSVRAEDDGELRREFEERLRESGTLATRVAFAVLRNREDAEDVAQEALVRAFRRFRSLRDRDRFRSWLVRISWRLALDHRRTTNRRGRRELAVVESNAAQDAEQVASDREFRRRLFDAIDELPGRLRIVIWLAAIEGYTTSEVASVLSVAEGTVKSRLHAARRLLAQRLR